MSVNIERIVGELQTRYKVTEAFYPKISMEMELPRGLNSEVTGIAEQLEKNSFEVATENVFAIMELKKKLISYTETSEGEAVLEQYNSLLLEHIKPIGTTIPLELMFATGAATVILCVGMRFLLSFAGEAGKIAARKLLDKDDKVAKRSNMTVKEYRFLKNQVVILIENDDKLVSAIKKLKKKKRQRVQ